MATESSDGSYSMDQQLKMTLEFVQVKQSLDIIVFLSPVGTLTPRAPSLAPFEPSWIPQWLEPETWTDQRKKAYLRGNLYYRSVTNGCVNVRRFWNASRHTQPNFRVIDRGLQTKGIFIDTLHSLTTTYYEQNQESAPEPLSKSQVSTRSDSAFHMSQDRSSGTPLSHKPSSRHCVNTEFSSSSRTNFARQGSSGPIPESPNAPTGEESPASAGKGNGQMVPNKASAYMALFHLLNYHVHVPLTAEPSDDPPPDPKDSEVPFACEHIAFLSIFANLNNWKTIKSTTPELARWVKTNRDFPVKRFGGFCDDVVLSDYLRHPHRSLYQFLERKSLDDADVRVALLRTMCILTSGRRLALTKNSGYLGWVPAAAQRSDCIALLAGCTVPVVLRPRPAGGFVIVGDCHFHGLMDGEGIGGNAEVGNWPYIDIY